MSPGIPVGISFLKTYLFLDPLPDDAGHLISVELDNGLSNLNLAECRESTLRYNFGQHLLLF